MCERIWTLPVAEVFTSFRECDGHHAMSDLGAVCERVHSNGESVEPVCPAPATRSLAKWSEAIMTTATDELRELRDDELDSVSGGLVVIAILAILIGLPPAPPLTPFPHNPP
jgi:hypothetical protein